MQIKYKIGGVVLLLAVAAVAFYSTPYIALYSIHRAVERNDAEAVSRYVDFPVLRENIREKVMDHMAAITPPPSSGVLGDLGQRLAIVAANQMVDNLVTPEGVMMLMDNNGSLQQLAQQVPQLPSLPQAPAPQAQPQPQAPQAAPALPSPPESPQAQGAPSVDTAQARSRARDVRVSYQGWSKVRVGVPREPGALIFRRDGLWGWRLVAVELPEPGRI